MIKFINIPRTSPYLIFKEKYDQALEAGQKNIEAVSISSYNNETGEVDSRFVNLKFIDGNDFIFFSNYKSPKSIAFESHDQIAALFYWSSINIQIRIKATINKTSLDFNKKYFRTRSHNKNALSISSNQSSAIAEFDDVIEKYNSVKENKDLSQCPDYWGGFFFQPYEIEFWEGNPNRLNKRDLYSKENKEWKHSILEP